MEGVAKNSVSESAADFLAVLNFLEYSARQNAELEAHAQSLKLRYEDKYLPGEQQKNTPKLE